MTETLKNCRSCIYAGFMAEDEGLVHICYWPDKRCGEDDKQAEGVLTYNPDEFCNSWETNSPDDDAEMAEPTDVLLLCVCQKCGFPEEGEAFQVCPICGGERVHVSHLDADEISDFWHDFDDCREPAGVGRLVSL